MNSKKAKKMFSCFVCKHETNFSFDLQNHVSRHRKSDIINAVIKTSSNENQNLSNASTVTLLSDEQPSDIKQEPEELPMQSAPKQEDSCKKKRKGRTRRSSRIKTTSISSQGDESYYIPLSSGEIFSTPTSSKSKFSETETGTVKVTKKKKPPRAYIARSRSQSKSYSKIEELLRTPRKDEVLAASDTDSCSDIAYKYPSSIELSFCSSCGNGYTDEEKLARHVHIQHINYCAICDLNFPDLASFQVHNQEHNIKVYLCPYCEEEFSSKDYVTIHMNVHLQESVLDNVLSLEQDYFVEKSYFNSMFNLFNAGYLFARKNITNNEAKLQSEFYEVFLRFASYDIEKHENFMCHICCNYILSGSLYREHMHFVHGINVDEMFVVD